MMTEFQAEMNSMNKYFFLRHQEYNTVSNDLKSLVRESEQEIKDLQMSLSKQIEVSNGLEEDLVYYKSQLMELQPQTQDGLTRSQFMASVGGDMVNQISVNHDLQMKIKSLEETVQKKNA